MKYELFCTNKSCEIQRSKISPFWADAFNLIHQLGTIRCKCGTVLETEKQCRPINREITEELRELRNTLGTIDSGVVEVKNCLFRYEVLYDMFHPKVIIHHWDGTQYHRSFYNPLIETADYVARAWIKNFDWL